MRELAYCTVIAVAVVAPVMLAIGRKQRRADRLEAWQQLRGRTAEPQVSCITARVQNARARMISIQDSLRQRKAAA